jgi:hypothetical protein
VGEGVVNHAPQRGGSVGAGDGGEEVMKVGGCDGGGRYVCGIYIVYR